MTTLKDRAQAIQEIYESKRSQLFRDDGTSLYSEVEQTERENALTAERNRALTTLEAEAASEAERIKGELANLQHAAPTDTLLPSERERAAVELPLAQGDIASLSTTGEVVNRLSAVLASGDRPSILVYMQAGRRHLKEVTGALQEELKGRGRPESWATPSPDLVGVLEAMEQKLTPHGRADDLQRAHNKLEEVEAASSLAWSLKRGGSTPARAYMNNKYARINH